jgi:exodeoxyribonuclease III
VYEYVKILRDKGECVILCGDLNTTVADIDLARPKENHKTTGCLPEEREALDWFLRDGFVDSYRHFYPEKEAAYSYWDQITRARDRNVGWRIDYFLVDQKLLPYLKDAYIWSEVMGSDHCPVGVDLDL